MSELETFEVNEEGNDVHGEQDHVIQEAPQATDNEKYLAIIVNGNAVLQFIADLVLEIMHIIPTRVNHLSLTFLNAFIAFKTLSAVDKGRFQFLHEDCQFLFLMEICLIVGDVYYMIKDQAYTHNFLYARLAFIILSLFNWLAVTYIICKYRFYSLGYQGGDGDEKHPSSSKAIIQSLSSLFKMKNIEDQESFIIEEKNDLDDDLEVQKPKDESLIPEDDSTAICVNRDNNSSTTISVSAYGGSRASLESMLTK